SPLPVDQRYWPCPSVSRDTHSTASTSAGSSTLQPSSRVNSIRPSSRRSMLSSGCLSSFSVQRPLSPRTTSLTCPGLPITGRRRSTITELCTASLYAARGGPVLSPCPG